MALTPVQPLDVTLHESWKKNSNSIISDLIWDSMFAPSRKKFLLVWKSVARWRLTPEQHLFSSFLWGTAADWSNQSRDLPVDTLSLDDLIQRVSFVSDWNVWSYYFFFFVLLNGQLNKPCIGNFRMTEEGEEEEEEGPRGRIWGGEGREIGFNSNYKLN